MTTCKPCPCVNCTVQRIERLSQAERINGLEAEVQRLQELVASLKKGDAHMQLQWQVDAHRGTIQRQKAALEDVTATLVRHGFVRQQEVVR